MLIFKDGQEREINRHRALGMRKVVISGDVNRGDEIELSAIDSPNGGILEINRKADQTVADENPIYTFITNEIGLYGWNKGLKSLIEVKLCDDVMIVSLIAGSIVIRPDGQEMKASRGINPDQLPACNTDEIKWVSVEDLLGFTKYFGKLAGMFPYDYEYTLEISGSLQNKCTNFTVRPYSESCDISCGALAIKEEEMAKKEEAKEARKMASVFEQASSKVSEGYGFDEDEEEETEEEEDDGYYDYK